MQTQLSREIPTSTRHGTSHVAPSSSTPRGDGLQRKCQASYPACRPERWQWQAPSPASETASIAERSRLEKCRSIARESRAASTAGNALDADPGGHVEHPPGRGRCGLHRVTGGRPRGGEKSAASTGDSGESTPAGKERTGRLQNKEDDGGPRRH